MTSQIENSSWLFIYKVYPKNYKWKYEINPIASNAEYISIIQTTKIKSYDSKN